MRAAPTLPGCCAPCDDGWPFPVALPGIRYESLDFDSKLFEPASFERCGLVPPPAIRRSVAKRQAEFLAGRLCADRALRGLTGSGGYPAMGPDRGPVWPDGVRGSISHCAGRAAAVVAPAGRWAGLGLDLEDRIGEADAASLGDLVAGPAEIAALLPRAGAAATALVLALSLKESLFKALHPLTGTLFYCEDAEILPDPADGVARLRLLRPLSPDWPAGRCLDARFALAPRRIFSLVAVPADRP